MRRHFTGEIVASSPRQWAEVAVLGPIPPPINGQSVVTEHFVKQIGSHFFRIRVIDTDRGGAGGLWGTLTKLCRFGFSIASIGKADVVYMAVKADRGMWLTALSAGVARLRGSHIFLHHHSYSYCSTRKRRMVALTWAAGESAYHIVLSRSMENELRRAMPEIRNIFILGNASLVDRTLLELPLSADVGDLVIGHLSNLCIDKGIVDVVELALRISAAGRSLRLIVGGPTLDDAARREIERAERELGEDFEYRGPLVGDAKRAFFQEITHFVLPSRYVHEAAPLVIYEALAAGCICVTTPQGSMPEQLGGAPGVVSRSVATFVQDVLPAFAELPQRNDDACQSRRAYEEALNESETQMDELVALMENLSLND